MRYLDYLPDVFRETREYQALDAVLTAVERLKRAV